MARSPRWMTSVTTTGIDRISSTRRPEGSAAGTQRWRKLLFTHWPIPVEAVRAVVPAALELDLWEGQAWVGLVPFAMEGVKPWWAPELVAFSFLETNVRTYVTYKGEPGVYFLSLEAASTIAVEVARWRWGLPYHRAHMSMEEEGGEVTYSSTRYGDPAASLKARYRLGELMGPSRPGSLEHFFLERYLLFVERGGEVLRGQVYHTPYPAQRVEVLELSEGLLQATGLPAPEGPPVLAHYAEGVDVEIFDLKAVP